MAVARRTVLQSAASLPLAAVLADPMIARAVAQGLDTVALDLPSGRTVSAALALPDRTPAGAVLLIHEWWGLNDQIRAMAAELANLGYVALAVDLFGGEVAQSPSEAQALTRNLDPAEARETLSAWIDWLRAHAATTDRVATMGWCFGGGWSLNASLANQVDATVIYYGRVPTDAADLAGLNAPVLGHFGEQDQFITPAMARGFDDALDQVDVPHQIHLYDADHAFANPTGGAYDQADARQAWARTTEFLADHIG